MNINKADLQLLESVYITLKETEDDGLINLFNDYIEKQKLSYFKKLESKRVYINKKRKADPLYARSKLEIERYNKIHSEGAK